MTKSKKTPQVKPDWATGIWNGRTILVMDEESVEYSNEIDQETEQAISDLRDSSVELD